MSKPKTIAEREADRACRDFKRPEWDMYTDTEFAWFIRVAISRALVAERRRIRKAIRAEIARVEEECDAMAREPLPNRRRNQRAREDCARIVQGLDVALRAVAVTRNRKDGV